MKILRKHSLHEVVKMTDGTLFDFVLLEADVWVTESFKPTYQTDKLF